MADPEQNPLPKETLLRAFYGLTPAEATVAAALSSGNAPEHVADTLGYTRQTINWYTKQILAKANCRSRSAFVREVSTTLPSLNLETPED